MGKSETTTSNELARRMKVSRNTKTAALIALEEAGLVKLKRVRQRVTVTLCEADMAHRPKIKRFRHEPTDTYSTMES